MVDIRIIFANGPGLRGDQSPGNKVVYFIYLRHVLYAKENSDLKALIDGGLIF